MIIESDWQRLVRRVRVLTVTALVQVGTSLGLAIALILEARRG